MTISSSASSQSKQPWQSHPDREEAISELHARPPLSVEPNDRIYYVGFTCGDDVLGEIIDKFGSSVSPESAKYHLLPMPSGQSKLEIHTEFRSLTILARDDESDLDPIVFLASVLPAEKIRIIVLVEMILFADAKLLDGSPPEGQRLFGGTMRGGLGVRSSLSPDDNGTISYRVCVSKNSPDEIGRRIQRLLEMETYRTMCLLGLPMARRISKRLQVTEKRLKDVIATLDNAGHQNEEELFNKLLELSQECTAMQSETRFRFSASHAYYELVKQRLESLEEESADGFQTITGFVRSRLDPAMATIESTKTRQATLIEDLTGALSLLRTRIDLGLNKDNQDLLKSMNARHRQQVLIAQTVEGLSTVAITYYAIGLLSYLVKGFEDWLPSILTPKIVIAASVPLILSLTWLSLRRMHSRWKDGAK